MKSGSLTRGNSSWPIMLTFWNHRRRKNAYILPLILLSQNPSAHLTGPRSYTDGGTPPPQTEAQGRSLVKAFLTLLYLPIGTDFSCAPPYPNGTWATHLGESPASPSKNAEGREARGLGDIGARGHWRILQWMMKPVVLFPKLDGTLWFCMDFRKVNAISRFDAYPMPWVDELLDYLGEA